MYLNAALMPLNLNSGRARVRANIQSVMIITKARDNRLIKLTRELALYLMLTPRGHGRGLIVCVRLFWNWISINQVT